MGGGVNARTASATECAGIRKIDINMTRTREKPVFI